MAVIGGRIDAAIGKPRMPVFGAGQGWSPYYLGSSLLADWDASRTDLLTLSGSNVLSWVDVRNGLVQSQATSTLQPLFDPTGINGNPAIVFDGTDDIMRGNPANVPAVLPQGSIGAEIWMLLSQTSPGSNGTGRDLFGYGSASPSGARRLQRVSIGGINRVRALIGDGTSSQFISDSTIDFTGLFVLRLRVSATFSTLYVNGSSVGTWSGTPVTAATGYGFGGTTGGGCSISRTLITDLLTDDQANLLTSHLKLRAGIT